MEYGDVVGLAKKVSKLIIGCELRCGDAVWDRYIDLGGTVFDTSHVWEDGLGERLLGNWLGRRRIANETVVIVKGGHTPYCDPNDLLRQIDLSLSELGMSKADIFLLHRDNLQVPVAELMDALIELVNMGRTTVFGVSNWSLRRLHEARTYLRRIGARNLGVVSNYFSLARMVRPVHQGLESSRTRHYRKYLEESRLNHFGWSSQAGGYFYGRTSRQTEAYQSADNGMRRSRADVLASELGVTAGCIAAAYVFNQTFKSFAIMGFSTPEQLGGIEKQLAIKLSVGQLEWLNLERDNI